MRLISARSTNDNKTHAVKDKGKIVSKHRDFYLAQCAVEKYLRTGKIGNDYEIIVIAAANNSQKGE